MKYIIALIALLSFAFVADRYTVTLPLSGWDKHINGLNYIQQTIDNSTLPANQVKFIRDSIIAPLQQDIIGQVRQQLPKDTTKKK